MVPALRVRRAKPVNEWEVNTYHGKRFDSAHLHGSVLLIETALFH